MSTIAMLTTSVGIAVLLAVPSFLMGALDPMEFGIAAGYSAGAAALACVFAPQLSKF